MTSPDPRRWRALAVSQIAGFMALLDVTIVNVALPTMQRGLHASPADIQWVVSGYALAFGLVLVAAGRLGDAVGRRRMFLVALTVFVATSALCGLAPNAESLIAARLAQGVAAGALAPQNTGLIHDLFTGPERGRAFGVFGSTISVSTGAGPLAGGLILALAHGDGAWRWVFLVNVPIGLVALIAAVRLLPRGDDRLRAVRLRSQVDVLGALLLGAAVVGVLLPLVHAETGGGMEWWWLFPVAAALGLAFVRWEVAAKRRGRAPLLDPALFTRTPGYPGGAMVAFVFFIGFSGIWLVLALHLQDGLGYSPLASGLVVTPFALGAAVAAAVAGRVLPRLGRRVTVIGLLLVVAGFTTTAFVLRAAPADAVWWAAIVPLLVGGLGAGAVISPNTALTLERVPPSMGGAAGGALQTGHRVGAALGTTAAGAVFYTVLASGTGRSPDAIAAALLTCMGFVLLGVGVAWWELRRLTRAAAAGGDGGGSGGPGPGSPGIGDPGGHPGGGDPGGGDPRGDPRRDPRRDPGGNPGDRHPGGGSSGGRDPGGGTGGTGGTAARDRLALPAMIRDAE